MSQFQIFISRAVIIICVALLTVAVMSPGLKGDFFFDDISNIVKNQSIHITELTSESLQHSLNGPVSGPIGRPVSVLSFAITHYFFGLDPFSFKTVNLIIHLANGLFIGWLISLLLGLGTSKIKVSTGLQTWLPVWVSAAWLIHPINILPVMLVVQRMTLLATMFLLLALICHLKAILIPNKKKWAWLCVAWLVVWPMAILSKETGLLFPIYILVITFFLLDHPKRNLMLWSLTSLLIVIALMAMSYLGWDWLEQAYTVRQFTLAERLMTEARVLWFYTTQIIAPNYYAFGIYLDYFTISKGLFDPLSTILSVIGWAVATMAIFFWRKQKPILCLGVAWFLMGHSLESSFLALEIAHEHRNYMPSIGLILGIGYWGGISFHKLKMDHKKLFTYIMAVVPLLILALFTWMRADQLGNPLLGAQIEASRHPLSSRANYAAAHSLFQAGLGDINDPIGSQQIRYYFLESSRLDKSSKHGYLGLIVWSCASGRPIDIAWVNELSHRFEHMPFPPGDRKLPYDLLKHLLQMPTCLSRNQALLLLESGAKNKKLDNRLRADFYEAAASYELLVALEPTSAKAYLTQALALTPYNPALQRKLFTIYPGD